MGPRGDAPDDGPKRPPKIVKIGSNWRSLGERNENKILPSKEGGEVFQEISIDSSNWMFEENQNSKIMILDDGIIEVTALQKESTPGVKIKIPISLKPGDYILTAIAHADVESTFFPWAIDSEKVRLTPTVHILTQEEPVSVPFRLEKEGEIIIGVLCHRQEVGDKCYISSLHISRMENSVRKMSKGNFFSFSYSDFVPHQNTTLEESSKGTIVRSKPISTPGVYSIVPVQSCSEMTIFTEVSVVYPSVAFLYIADANTGKEIIRRNVIFESYADSSSEESSELFSSFYVPEGTDQIRVGILFSTVTEPDEHIMTIHNFEVSQYHNLNDIASESYVLNLDEDQSKFNICERQASRFGLEMTRWPAVDGRKGQNNLDWIRYMEEPWTDLDDKLGRKAIDKPGAWGYLLTMKGIFEDAIKKNHDSIAVFDDDFIFSKSFDHGFSRLVEVLDDSWDILYLGSSQWLWDGISITNEPFYSPDENTNGSFAVIYRNTVFQEILDHIGDMSAPFDAGALRKSVMGNFSGSSFVSYPNLVIANVEKTGIRDSRNQIEFSKRFGWDLSNFPAWFTNWSLEPTILLESQGKSAIESSNFVTAVTTIDRRKYLEQFIEDWNNTRDKEANRILIVADDGSTDGTLEWLCEELELPDSMLVVIRNDGLGIARQTNSIIDYVRNMDFRPDAIFMCNDDIRFLQPGWDKSYFQAMSESGYDHLVYFNPDWKDPSHSEGSPRFSGLESSCSARDAMGCFYTLTPRLIETIGFFDEASFPVRGHSHVDYTLRACRVEANDSQFLYDISDSNESIGMILRDGYKRTHRTLSVWERKVSSSDESLAKRESVLLSEGRTFVPRGW
jgi:hypothetical protein